MTPSGKSSAKQSLQSLVQASNYFFLFLTKASGTDELRSLFLMSQILPRYFTQKKLHRQAVTIHSKGAFFYLFVLLSSIYGFPLTVQNRESEIVVPLPKRKMDWGQSPAEGSAVSR